MAAAMILWSVTIFLSTIHAFRAAPRQNRTSPHQAALTRAHLAVLRAQAALENSHKETQVLSKVYTKQLDTEESLKKSLMLAVDKYQDVKKKMGPISRDGELAPEVVPKGTEELIREAHKTQQQFQATSVPQSGDETFDIVINAFKRDKFLNHSIQEYLKCSQRHGGNSSVKHIWVIWNDNKREIPSYLRTLQAEHDMVTFVVTQGEDRLSNRFTPLAFKSNAVFHVDDDMLHMCSLLDDMFEIWKTDTDGMVGTSPRKKDLLTGGQECWACPLIWGEYNIVFITKGAIMHRRFFDEYFKSVWQPIREVVDEKKCAEDLLMSAVHASIVGSGHVYAMAGSVNKGTWMVQDLAENTDIESEFGSLNGRTWGARGEAMDQIAEFLRATFPEQAERGYFSRFQKQWWRSKVNAGQSCRAQAVACFNRAWDSCAVACEAPVRGNSACFTGDSACYAGMHLGTPFNFPEQDQIVCIGEHCTM